MHSKKEFSVAHIIDSLSAGGAEQMAVSIVNGLKEQKIDVCLIVTRKTGLLAAKLNKEIPLYILCKKNAFDFISFLSLLRIIKNKGINIVHAHSSSIVWASFAKLFYKNIKIIWHDHYGKSEQLENRKTLVYKLCSNAWSKVIVVNAKLAGWSYEKLNIQKGKIELLNNFVSYSSPQKVNELENSEFYNVINLICVANIRPEKDHTNLLNAFEIIASNNNHVVLHLIGIDPENDYARKILKKIKEHPFEDRIFYWGQRSNVFSWLQYMDMGILSSESEGLPVALLEYGLADLKIVATSVGQINKVLDNGRLGYIVPAKNPGLLADTISEAIESPEAAVKASLFKREVEEIYSEKIVITQLVEIYKNTFVK